MAQLHLTDKQKPVWNVKNYYYSLYQNIWNSKMAQIHSTDKQKLVWKVKSYKHSLYQKAILQHTEMHSRQ